MSEKPRWQYRFDNYRRTYILLQEAVEQANETELSQLAKEGTIQRFEFCMEMAWKTMKDFLEHQGVSISQITPRSVIKEAVAGKLISDGETWMKALDTRNKMSHSYTKEGYEAALKRICSEYIGCFSELYETLAIEYHGDG